MAEAEEEAPAAEVPGPKGKLGPDNFSARWTGFVVPEHTETYTFYTLSDDGVRLLVDGEAVIEN